MVNTPNENVAPCSVIQKTEADSKDNKPAKSHSSKYLEEFARLQKELIRLSLHIENLSSEKPINTNSDALVQRYNRKLEINNNDKIRKSSIDNYSNGPVDQNAKAFNKAEAASKAGGPEAKRKKDKVAKKLRTIVDKEPEKDTKNPKICKFEKRLKMYINSIVKEYIAGTDKESLFEELKFTKELSQLQEHAELLVSHGLGRIVEEELRVNHRNYSQSFITMSRDRLTTVKDGVITATYGRSHAFHGDIVRAFVFHSEPQQAAQPTDAIEKEEKEPNIELAEISTEKGPKAFVISIVKEVADRLIIGTMDFASLHEMKPKSFYKIQPIDTRYPFVKVKIEDALRFAKTDETMKQRNDSSQDDKKDDSESFVVVHIQGVDKGGEFYGELKEYLGQVNDLASEMKAILRTNGFNEDELYYFENCKEIPPYKDAQLDEKALTQYKDLRKKCIFTIDPLTARDLDDALSLEVIDDDTFEIGVHISDVSAYICENTQLDEIVRDRATSIYLGTKVVHMLPTELCMKCSLLPGQDKLAFSVFWQLNGQGEIIAEGQGTFHRSLINSCTQFAYEHAQLIIDSADQQLDASAFPAIHNGFTLEDIAMRVRHLNALAKNMRRRRFENGSLSLNNPKLRFTFDNATGEPIEYSLEERGEANFLIEEFMLLANQEAARLTFKRYPENCLLRSHGPPLAKSMNTILQKLSKLDLKFDASTSKAVYESMQRLCAKQPDVMDAFLNVLLTKPMARAKYFCPEGETSEALMRHYALSIPIYTHFTSPIRRYADIIVHRHLAAALDYCPPTARTGEEITEFAMNCNEKSYNAKKAGEDCSNMYFRRYITAHKAILKRAVIFEIYQTFFNAVTIDTGHVITVNYADQSCPIDTAGAPNYVTISGNKRLQPLSDIEVLIKVVNKSIVGFIGKNEIKKFKAANNASDKVLHEK